MNDFRTLPQGKFQQTLVVQKSRFLAFASRVASCSEAQGFIKSVALPDATHHCYAYITSDGQKSCDNGEPAGTAGLPILQAIRQQNLMNVVVVVERYFGGIKLGTGGLARAYGQAANQVLTSVDSICMRNCIIMDFDCNYEQQSVVVKLVEQFGKSLGVQYQDVIMWKVAVPFELESEFRTRLAEVLRSIPQICISPKSVLIEFPS